MQDNKKLFMGLFLIFGYGILVIFKLADPQVLVGLITYAVKKLFDMHEDAQSVITPKQEVVNAPKTT